MSWRSYSRINGVPPIMLHDSRPSFWVLIMPYVEQQAVYDDICKDGWEAAMQYGTAPASGAASAAAVRYRAWWDNITTGADGDRRAFYSSIPIFKCPTRRGGSQYDTEHATATSDVHMPIGPCGDFAVAVFVREVDGSDASTGTNSWYAHYTSNNNEYQRHRGPIRVSILTGVNVNSCVPRDTFAWWSDGTSNQIIIGEKHVPDTRLNACRTPWWDQGDCSIFTSNSRCGQSVGRQMLRTHHLARSPKEFLRDHNDDSPVTGYGYGSYHPGVCQFLFGDGAVRVIGNMAPFDTVMCPLTEVNDGKIVDATAIGQ